jgi:RHH-type rel operon transcriptional repressor/antitoxin RelB
MNTISMKEAPPMSATVSVRVDAETKQRLERLAKATDRTTTYVVRDAIREYLDTNEWQIEAIQEAVDAADRPDAEFVDHENVAAWLESWGTADEQGPPR